MNIPHRSVLGLSALLAAGALSPARAQGLPDAVLAPALALAREAAGALAPPGARIEIDPGVLDRRLHLAPCARVETYLPAATRAWGRTRVGLRCVQGPTAWNVFLPLTVKVLAPGLVATLPLPAGTVIGAGQLQPAEVDWAAEASPVQVHAEALLGRTLAHPVGAGQPVRAADVRPRQWFAAGDSVRIVTRGAGFSVSGEGQAVSNGIEGQLARVRTDSGRLLNGHPVGERRVEVAL